MIKFIDTLLLKILPSRLRIYLRDVVFSLFSKSLDSAINEQGFRDLFEKLEKLVPDISDQYSLFKVDTPHVITITRGLHAFQISLVQKVIENIENPMIVDIGDSSGTHLQYISGLNPHKKIECLGINLDATAIRKIQSKGLKAIQARAENLSAYNIDPDIFLCFETLEHLMNPSCFLHDLSSKTKAQYLIVNIPYVKNSRIGLHHIRAGQEGNVYAENTHIFELDPEDWKLLFKHSGWNVVTDKIYYQYPKISIWGITKPLWRYSGYYEGFYGLILKRDDTWSSKYLDW